jgi:hypothetical protein
VTPPGGAPLPDFTKAREALKVLWGSYAAEVIGSVLDAAELALASQQQEIETLRQENEALMKSLVEYQYTRATSAPRGGPNG